MLQKREGSPPHTKCWGRFGIEVDAVEPNRIITFTHLNMIGFESNRKCVADWGVGGWLAGSSDSHLFVCFVVCSVLCLVALPPLPTPPPVEGGQLIIDNECGAG